MLWTKNKGQNLIEAIIAIALFGILVMGGIMTDLRHLDSQIRAETQIKISQFAYNSFEILSGLAHNNWTSLTNGTHGLTYTAPDWSLSETPDVVDNVTRTITITEAERDGNCELVSSNGTIDPDTKIITLDLDYDDNRGAQKASFVQNFTRWAAPTNCLVITEAGNLNLDVSGAYIDATKKSLFGLVLHNTGNTIITLDKMTFSWNTGGNITYVKINGANYWHATNGIGLPQGAQPSGVELDLVNFVLQPQSSYQVDNVRFDTKVDGATFTIIATMLDNSSKTEITSPPFIP